MAQRAISPIDERRQYVSAFNDTMIKIWKERISALGAVDSGSLYRSIILTMANINADASDIHSAWNFNEYGVFVDRGTGREVPRGNPGDIGRDKARKAKPWMSRAFWASYCNIRDFMAESLGQQFVAALATALGSSKF